ncbi:MAG: GIY-YIG nuclease family protein [Thermochromatium sp.]
MDDDCGTYLVWLIPMHPGPVRIGRLGTLLLAGGDLLYVGSALGPGGWWARCRHHERLAVRPHWHLDYLRPHCRVVGGWMAPGRERREHVWARALGTLPEASWPLMGFGSSDCDCPAHLIRLDRAPETAALSALLGVPLIPWRSDADRARSARPPGEDTDASSPTSHPWGA